MKKLPTKLLSGFTLIELLVVIALIGVTASVVLIAINPLAQLQKANDARRRSDLAQIQKAVELYFQDNKSYPVSTSTNLISQDGGTTGVAWGTSLQSKAGTVYMVRLPADPTTGKQYVYVSDGTYYLLYTALDRPGDGQNPCASGICASSPAGACGTTRNPVDCNYGISSPDRTP